MYVCCVSTTQLDICARCAIVHTVFNYVGLVVSTGLPSTYSRYNTLYEMVRCAIHSVCSYFFFFFLLANSCTKILLQLIHIPCFFFHVIFSSKLAYSVFRIECYKEYVNAVVELSSCIIAIYCVTFVSCNGIKKKLISSKRMECT